MHSMKYSDYFDIPLVGNVGRRSIIPIPIPQLPV